MIEILLGYWKLSAPLLVIVGGWLFNEWKKREWEQYKRKEESYKKLLECLKGFYDGSSEDISNKQQDEKQDFLDQYAICWLYCPDDVIRKINAFTKMVESGADSSEKERNEAAQELILYIRRDLISRNFVKSTNLKKGDFRILSVNKN